MQLIHVKQFQRALDFTLANPNRNGWLSICNSLSFKTTDVSQNLIVAIRNLDFVWGRQWDYFIVIFNHKAASFAYAKTHGLCIQILKKLWFKVFYWMDRLGSKSTVFCLFCMAFLVPSVIVRCGHNWRCSANSEQGLMSEERVSSGEFFPIL